MKKLFVVQKYIFASSAKEAIRLDKKTAVDECFVDGDWKKANISVDKGEMGFIKK